MKKVLFTHSYFLRLDPKQWKLQQPYAPLATITAAAYLRKHGYQVELFDTMFRRSGEELAPVLARMKPDHLVIYDDGFNYLTKMCLTNMRQEAFRMARMASDAGCKVIVASSDATDHAEKYLGNGADYVIAGEAEQTLLELLDSFENKTPIEAIQGIIYTDGLMQIARTPARPVMRDLDSLPVAAWDLVDITTYKEAWYGKYGYLSLNIATTRGCPYKCNWCAKPIYGNRYNSRTPEHVVRELKMLHETIGFEHIWFCDDIFGLKPGWIAEFKKLLKKEGLRCRFKIQSRADILLKDNMIEDLAEAGCETIWIGAESGSQRILDAMDKGITVEQIYEAVQKIKTHNMNPALFLQLGYMGETKKDIRATLKMLFDLMPHDIGVSVSYPLPGTKFYDKVKEELSQKANWKDSDDLDLMFSNTYSPAYYKRLHRYIHKKFRKRQAIAVLKEIALSPSKASGTKVYRAASALYYMPASFFTRLRLRISY